MDASKTSWFGKWMVISTILLLPLLFGAYNVFIIGQKTLAATDRVPWNLFVVAYAFFVSGIGLCYLGSLGMVLNISRFNVIAKRALFLSIAFVLTGLVAIIMDIGRPLRAINYMLSPNFQSPLWWLGSLYGIYLVALVGEYLTVAKLGHQGPIPKRVAIVSFIIAVAVHSSLGGVFGMTYAKPMWYGPYYPIYFIVSAMLAALAIFIPMTILSYRVTEQKMDPVVHESLKMLGRLFSYVLLVAAFFYFWKVKSGLFSGQAEMKILFSSGDWAVRFFAVEWLIGYIIPWIILATPKLRTHGMMSLASVFVIVGMFVGRYHFVILGQLMPPFPGQVEGMAVYSPNLVEIAAVVGMFGLVAFLYGLGLKFLPIAEDVHALHEKEEDSEVKQAYQVSNKQISKPKVYGRPVTAQTGDGLQQDKEQHTS